VYARKWWDTERHEAGPNFGDRVHVSSVLGNWVQVRVYPLFLFFSLSLFLFFSLSLFSHSPFLSCSRVRALCLSPPLSLPVQKQLR
jgi:hypothetical protein